MKNALHPFARICFLPVFFFVLIGCSSTNRVTMSVQQPAAVSVPASMKEIGVINRSLTNEPAGVMETIDQIFSIKGPELDSLGSVAGIESLTEELRRNDRFTRVVKPERGTERLENPSYGVFPAPLSWAKVEEISSEYNLDGLFSLEFYNTSSNVEYSTRRVTLEGPLGVEIPALEHHAEVHTTIKTGWRIYDTHNRRVLDEYVRTDVVTTGGRGINPMEAVRAVTGRTEAVKTVSGNMGRYYARSILPYYTRVSREYYVRGNDNMKMARRRAQTGNWDGAAEIWLAETENPRAKVAGRAHYNMAIINEINGDLENAIEWAGIAYEDYGDRRALRYLRILRNRMARAELLREQMDY
jgi:hypothetical protein